MILVEAFEHFPGKPSGLDDSPGGLSSADYILQMVTPTGKLYSYSDCALRTGLNLPQYWFARKTGRADLRFANAALLATARADKPLPLEPERVEALALLWLDPKLAAPPPPRRR